MPARESTDQKVGGSSPSERAQVKGRLPHSNRLSLCPRTATRTATGGMGGYSMQGWAETGSTRLVLVGLVAVELVAQPTERVPGHLVRYLGVDLHRERYAAVPEYRHGDARVHVERGQQGGARPAGVVNRDPADSVPRAPEVRCTVDIPWLDRAPVP